MKKLLIATVLAGSLSACANGTAPEDTQLDDFIGAAMVTAIALWAGGAI
jgi:hypothetical protein